MHTLISHVTTALLLVHAVLGCCCHHAHGCESECCETPAPADAKACPCGHHDEDSAANGSGEFAQDAPHPSHNPQGHTCQGERCTFVRTDRSPEQVGDFALTGLYLVNSAEVFNAADSNGVADLSEPAHASFQRLRTHLLFRVLLI